MYCFHYLVFALFTLIPCIFRNLLLIQIQGFLVEKNKKKVMGFSRKLSWKIVWECQGNFFSNALMLKTYLLQLEAEHNIFAISIEIVFCYENLFHSVVAKIKLYENIKIQCFLV